MSDNRLDMKTTSSNPSTKYFQHLLFSLIGLMTVFLYGCPNDPDAVYVDFSQRADIGQRGEPSADRSVLNVAVGSMISAQETVVQYHRLLDYIAEKLGRDIQLVQRKTYREINELLGLGKIDLAFICSGPYVIGKQKYHFEALAMPEVRGSHLYQSFLIVNKESSFQKLADLRGRIFAFTDPESNTGKLVPTYWLSRQGETAEAFFQKTVYTYSHDNSIMAVAMSLVDGAAVHGLIWEYYQHRAPVYTSKTRIIKKSEFFGNPPVVVSSHLSGRLKKRIQELLLAIHRNPEGKKILNELMIDRFITPQEKSYEPVLAMIKDTGT